MPSSSDEDDDEAAGVAVRAVPGVDAHGCAAAVSRGGPRSRGGPPPAASAGPKLVSRLRRYRQLGRRHWLLCVGALGALVFVIQLLFILLYAAPLEADRARAAEGSGWEEAEQVLLDTLADRGRVASGSLQAVAAGRLRRWAEAASEAVSLPGRWSTASAEDDGPVNEDMDEGEQDASVTPTTDSDAPLQPESRTSARGVSHNGAGGNTSLTLPRDTFRATKPTPPTPPRQSSSPRDTAGRGKQGPTATDEAVTVPVRPAIWAQGGGSVRVLQAFTVLTVLTGPPMTATELSAEAPGRRPARLLRRAAIGLVHAGVTRHPSFHEWLLVHNVVLEGPHAQAASEETAAVRRWWASAAASDQDRQQQSHGEGEQPRMRVAGLAHTTLSNPQMQKAAFALVHGARLVLTEYVLLHDLRLALPRDGIAATFATFSGSASPISHATVQAGTQAAPAAAAAAAAAGPVAFSFNNTVAQREITLGLQTLSKNDFKALPVMVVDDVQGGMAEDVHAYRLNVYTTQDWRQPEREAALQATLIEYVRRARPASSPSTTTSTLSPLTTKPKETSAVTGPKGAENTSSATAKASSTTRVQDGLPILAYSASAHFHCQHAPLYAVRMPVPMWLRRFHHSTSSTARPASAARRSLTAKPALTTLCEALVSQHIGLGEAFAVQGGTFHRLFCQDWLQFTLLPSPKTPARKVRPGEDDGGAVGEGVDALLENLRGAPAQKPSDAEAQRMDMTQRLGDGLCAVEWLAHLKAAQLRYIELAERRRSALGKATRPSPPSREHLALTNVAGRSPYLDQYAALLFSDNVTQLSRLAGTYLAFLPNVSYALSHVRNTMESKLAYVTVKHAVERGRRFLSVKQPTDREVVCVASHLVRADRMATLYKTQWFLTSLGLRCVQHKSSCLGSLNDSNERSLQILDGFFSTTGKWGRGEYRVCASAGAFVSDPSSELL